MTNSFWREVLDHIPGLFLIFRLDDKENTHLIFANSHIRNVLGYKPEEFVLASESQGSVVQAQINTLVEKIAERSKSSGEGREKTQNSSDSRPVCLFHSKRAAEHSFHFEYRIFSVKSSPYPFIAVSLTPLTDELPEVRGKAAFPVHTNTEFIAESPLMQALMRKVDALADQQTHLLFRGDRATGKRTLARQVLQAGKLSGARCLEWNLESMPIPEQNRAVDRMCGNGRTEDAVSANEVLILLIIEISMLTVSNQSRLLDWLRDRQDSGSGTRILATTSFLLEERMQQGDFSAELYYFLSFETLLLPPLSQRKEDLSQLVSRWTTAISTMLELGELNVSGRVLDQLLDYSWPGNFHEFHEVMRRSLLGSAPGSFRLILHDTKIEEEAAPSGPSALEQAGTDANGAPDTGIPSGEIIPFDEMNRRYLRSVLRKTDGKIYGGDGAAHLLGMKPTTLQSKLKKLGVK